MEKNTEKYKDSFEYGDLNNLQLQIDSTGQIGDSNFHYGISPNNSKCIISFDDLFGDNPHSFIADSPEKSPNIVVPTQARDVATGENSSLFCLLCQIELGSSNLYVLHLDSIEHQTKYVSKLQSILQKQKNYLKSNTSDNAFQLRLTCNRCDVICNSKQQFDQHMQSLKHLKKLQSAESSNILSNATDENELPNVNVLNMYHCEACGVMCTGQLPYDQHLAGEKHKKKVLGEYSGQKTVEGDNKIKTPPQIEKFECSLCQKQFSGFVPHDMHLASARHKKAVSKDFIRQRLIELQSTSSHDEEIAESFLSSLKVYEVSELDVTIVNPDVPVSFK